MSAVERANPADPGGLIAWAHAARAAHELAEPLCRTTFVPEHFRGDPAAATAAILYGAEAGLTPFQALQGVYLIQGRPAMYARTLLAIVLAAGHEVWTKELTDTRVVVCGRRRGSAHEETATWTIERARSAGYATKNKKYDTDPQAMLLARAQADMCRRLAPDAILGMAYSVEELGDEERLSSTPAARPAIGPPPPPPSEPESDELGRATQDVPLPPATDNNVTDAQLKKLHTAFSAAGITDRDLRLAYAYDVVGRELESSKDLTRDEASKVIESLAELEAKTAAEPAPDDGPGYNAAGIRKDDPRLGAAGADGWGKA